MLQILLPEYYPITEEAENNMKFTKMQGCGNDYIYIDGSREFVSDKSALAIRLSDRHFGIGGDGIIFINPSETADFEMEMYNADGSRGKMCGNGIRCVAKYVYDHRLTDKNPLTIESFGSIKTLYLNVRNGKVDTVRVDMGEPVLKASEIPADPSSTCGDVNEKGQLIHVPFQIRENAGLTYMTAVSMGNPHAVLFVDNTADLDMSRIGPLYEHHPAFPEGVNTEFVQILDRSHINMRVWERGSGETLACGTGACASVVACVLNGKTDPIVTVHLLGGDLLIEWNPEDHHVYMTGPAREVFTGEIPFL